ncbi:MAG: SiaB family protein kinase [Acidobacteriota bacterium]
MAEDLFRLYQDMSQRKIWLAFKGPISQGVLVELGTLLKNKSVLDCKVKKVFAIFTEMTQNILHYSAETKTVPFDGNGTVPVGVGVVVVSESADDYSVSAGNVVTAEQMAYLQEQCERIHNSDANQLKQYYDERLKAEHARAGSKGAGLGLIDIARKADFPLDYTMRPIADGRAFFVLTARIAKSLSS